MFMSHKNVHTEDHIAVDFIVVVHQSFDDVFLFVFVDDSLNDSIVSTEAYVLLKCVIFLENHG